MVMIGLSNIGNKHTELATRWVYWYYH